MKRKTLIILILLIGISFCTDAKDKNPKTKVENSSLKRYEGFFNFNYNEDEGKIILEVNKINSEFLYANYLTTGVGSNDIGLDRGQIGGKRIVKFIKAGNKLLLLQPNYDYRAISNNPDEIRAVEEAFAQSVLWGFIIEKEENGTYYINVTDFFLRDAHDVIGELDYTKQGNYKLDKSRSAIYLPRTKNFPKNTEFEATLTFTGNPEGDYIFNVVPSPESITIRQHHSFVQLPDKNFTPRTFDPRSGYLNSSYMDYATPINEPIEKRMIFRHRLEKKNPEAVISEAVQPIKYYLDRGAPEPIRSALLEGGRWWKQAFEAIGYKDAFSFELLPEGVDPLDIRYNVVQWVHRSTRGWSYGDAIIDPRTGEVIKGQVLLGSLRVRQDFLIATGLLAPYKSGDELPEEAIEMALARIKQLSAHEIGHALGLDHNFIASSEGRSSVMDYPHPLVEIKNDKLVLDNAYDDKIGAWDKVAIAYGYQDFPEGTNEKNALNEIIQNSLKEGTNFLSDQDARPKGSLHPRTHLWDNGSNAIDELNRVMKIRSIALNNFGEKNIPKGTSFVNLERVLVPIYFFHRYQIEATAKIIGGLDYKYAFRGDGQFITKSITSEEQLKALDALLETLSPKALIIPESILQMIPPRTIDAGNTREITNSRTGPSFDALGASESIAEMVISLILNPERACRLLEYHARNNNQPGLDLIIDILIKSTWKTTHLKGYEGEIQRTVDNVLLQNMIRLSLSKDASENAKAITFLKLDNLRNWLVGKAANEINERMKAHYTYAKNQIRIFQNNPEKYNIITPLQPPAGSPIGTDMFH